MNLSMLRFSKLRFIIRRISTINLSKDIKIPKKIYRDELSVLKALSNCVQAEKGNVLFKSIDQPFTLPGEFLKSKTFDWSKISGKFSARMAFNDIKNEFINVAHDEPRVKSLMPLLSAEDIKREVQENRLTPEKGLDKIVRLLSPVDAWLFYEAHKDAKFSPEVIQKLLELLCATNGVSLVQKDEYKSVYKEQPLVEWSITNNAELLFAEINPKTELSYCAIIRGASKFNHTPRALEHFSLMKEHFPESFLDLATINSLLRSLKCSNLRDQELESIILDLFEGMVRHKITPTTHTFNNAIFAFSGRDSTDFVRLLYNELISAGIEPTLGTYSVLLQCKLDEATLIDVVDEILLILESRNSDYEETTSVDDRTLFNHMIDLIKNMKLVDFGMRLINVVDRGGCFHMFLSEQDRSLFISNFVRLLLSSRMNLGRSLDIAARYVPTYSALTTNQVQYLINRISKSGDIHLLTKVVNMVTWRSKYFFESNLFSQILGVFLQVDYSDKSDLRKIVSDCLSRFLDESKPFIKTMFDIDDNMKNTVKLAAKLADDTLFWALIEFADSHGMVRASMVSSVMVQCFQAKNFDRVSYLWQCLARSVHSRAMVNDKERNVLRRLIGIVSSDIIPVMVDCNANVTDIRHGIDTCNNWLALDLTEADFDREEKDKQKLTNK